MFRFNLIIAIVFLTCAASFSQEKKTESLPKAARESSSRYEKFKSKLDDAQDPGVLLEEARQLKQTSPADALDKVSEAIGISVAGKDVFNEGKSYIVLGEINESIQEWKLAFENYAIAHDKLKRRFSKTSEYRQSLFGMASSSLKLGKNEEAQAYYNELLSMNLTPSEKTTAELGLSQVYIEKQDYDKARKAISEPNRVSSSGPARDSIDTRIQNQRARIYAKTKDVDLAKGEIESAQNTLRSAPSAAPVQTQDLQDAKEQVAQALHEQERYDDEIDLRNQSIEFNLETKNLPEVTKDKLGLGRALAAKGQTSEAIRELEETALMADTIDNPKDQARAYLALADLYEKNGRQQQALNTYKKYSQAVKKVDDRAAVKLTEKADLIRKQRDIEELTKDVAIGEREETIAEATVFRQQIIIYGLIAIILIIAVTSYFIYKNAQASKTANQLLALKSLRSQMNPHFIFNALNSVNHFVSQHDERTTNKFLSEFSRLMRLVMENSQEDFISLQKEQEIISLYLKLEHYRFRDKFEYAIDVDPSINPETIDIPPMLVQPHIENAVWHGLRYKETKGLLNLSFRKNSHKLLVEITDNGIGRKRSIELKTENQKKQNSTGLKNIEQRLNIINRVYHSNYQITIEDLDPATQSGTRVTIHVPIKSNANA